MRICCAKTIREIYERLLATFSGEHDPATTVSVRQALEILYPEAVAMFTDAKHPIHQVSRGFPEFPVFGPANSQSEVALVAAHLPRLPTGLAQRMVCSECSNTHHLVVLSSQLLRLHHYLLRVAGQSMEHAVTEGQHRLRVHRIDSTWDSVSKEDLRVLKDLLADCRSPSANPPASIPSGAASDTVGVMEMIRATGVAWLAAHELAHTTERNCRIPDDCWRVFAADPAYAKEEYEADEAGLKLLLHRSTASAPLDHDARLFLFVGCELMFHTLDVVQAAAESRLSERHDRESAQSPLSPRSRYERLVPLMTTHAKLFANVNYANWRLPFLCAFEVAIQRALS